MSNLSVPTTVRFLGTYAITTQSGIPINLRSQAAKSLLAYLLLHPTQSFSRSHLANLIASDTTENKARRKLSQVLWSMGQVLPDEFIQAEQETIRIHPDANITVDALAFADYMQTGMTSKPTIETTQALEQAIALYQGILLPSLDEDWVIGLRAIYERHHQTALEKLAQWEKQHGNYQRALTYLIQVIDHDSYREDVHRELIRLYIAQDRVRSAIEHYKQLEAFLVDEFEVEPEPATQELIANLVTTQNITSTHIPTAQSTTPFALQDTDKLPLIGRDDERVTLLGAVNHLLEGRGGTILVAGAPGIGKTKLIQTLAQDAEWRGAMIAWGNTQRGSINQPYYLIQDAITPLLTSLRIAQLATLIDNHWLASVLPIFPPHPRTHTRITCLTTY